jgi:hypothetical protein
VPPPRRRRGPPAGQHGGRVHETGGGHLFSRLRACEPFAGTGILFLQLGEIRQTGTQRLEPGPERGPLLLEPFLGGAEAFVAQHTGEELGPFRRAHCGHDRQLLLAGEVGVEELVPGHPQKAGDALGDGAETGDHRRHIAVLIQLGAGEAANHPILVRAEGELELHLDLGSRRCVAAANRLPAPPRGRHAVHRPGDGLQQSGLPRPVGPDDAGEAGAQLEVGELVLTEVGEANPLDAHQPAAVASRSTASINSAPVRTNCARSTSPGSGRRSR